MGRPAKTLQSTEGVVLNLVFTQPVEHAFVLLYSERSEWNMTFKFVPLVTDVPTPTPEVKTSHRMRPVFPPKEEFFQAACRLDRVKINQPVSLCILATVPDEIPGKALPFMRVHVITQNRDGTRSETDATWSRSQHYTNANLGSAITEWRREYEQYLVARARAWGRADTLDDRSTRITKALRVLRKNADAEETDVGDFCLRREDAITEMEYLLMTLRGEGEGV